MDNSPQIEYKYFNKMTKNENPEFELNEFGAQGWELIHFEYRNGYTRMIFKRYKTYENM